MSAITDQEKLKYIISLQLVPSIGPKLAKGLIAYCGSPEAIFKEKKSHLQKIPGIGYKTSESILSFRDFNKAENEVEFIKNHSIEPLFYLDDKYPRRLKDIEDAPIMLYVKGNVDLNKGKVLGIVGTRRATDYGKRICKKLVKDLAEYDVTIVSGLAYGIDGCAHKSALENQLPTIAVLGHGLDHIYPFHHRSLAIKMLSNGGLITEYISGTTPIKENFPERNRIIAGVVDAVIVIETAKRGGALITAEIAYSYNREIFAVPGRTGDEMSEGCNKYIKLNKASMIENANDIAYNLGWDIQSISKKKNNLNIEDLNIPEKGIIELLKSEGKLNIDILSNRLSYRTSELSLLLLDLEFRGYILSLPGNFYKIAI